MLLALTLIGISLWTAFGHLYGFSVKKAKWSLSSKLVLTGFIILLIQICYGSFTAGLKAGYISDTWPLMLGQLIPSGLLSQTPAAVDESDRRAADGRVHPPLVRIRWLDNRYIFLLAHSKTELLKRYKIRAQSYPNFGHHPNCIGNPDCFFARADRDCVTSSSQCPAPLFLPQSFFFIVCAPQINKVLYTRVEIHRRGFYYQVAYKNRESILCWQLHRSSVSIIRRGPHRPRFYSCRAQSFSDPI